MATIRVSRELLIRSMGAKMRTLNEAHRKAEEAHPAKVKSFCESAARQLHALAERVAKGDLSGLENEYNMSDYHVRVKSRLQGRLPEKPLPSRELCSLRGDIERLKLSKQDVIALKDKDPMLAYLDGELCRASR